MAGNSRYIGRMLDPTVVRDFARFILAKKESIEKSIEGINFYSQRVDEDWRDRQNHIFREQFVPHMQNMQNLSELLDQYATYCNLAAKTIEEYNQE